MRGLERGHERFKFFPAEAAGGVAALKSFAGPFPRARFCPTGGIDAASAPRFLALPNVLTVGGSWMLPKLAIDSGQWDEIERRAREATRLRAA
jgi:2-dehydro-3-deoxyphosphogluconate aldolase/(4S)-4-hydroxy-2-oxoglutarate aldolase